MAPTTRATLDSDPLGLAETAFARVEADAAGAAELAVRALRSARARHQPGAEVAALHALSYARHELGDPRSLSTVRAAVRVAERHGLAERAALARRRLSLDLAGRGRIAAALHELDLACAAFDELELARSQVFRIALLARSGRPLEPLAETDRALAILRRHGDAIWEARLLRNRGVVLAERGDIRVAESDLTRARDLYARLGAHEAAAGSEVELARVALARGDLPGCLTQLDAVMPAGLSPGHAADLEMLRARALAAAQLTDEALTALAEAQAIWTRWRVVDHEGRLEAVRLTLLAGDPRAALALARGAREWFRRRASPVHQARADGLALVAATAAGAVTRSGLRSARRAADTLAAAGWREEALRVRIAVARAAFELGAVDTARRELAACGPLRRHAPVADRIEAWHVEALLRRAAGDGVGAQRAARAGLELLDGYRAALGASDLRASVSAIGVALAQLGLRVALEAERPATILAWSERARASALRLDPVTPADLPALRDSQRDLRRVGAEIRAAETGGRAAQSLVAHQSALEASIRRLARHTAGGGGRPSAVPGRSAISAALGNRGLIELIELDGGLSALTLAGGRLVHHPLGPVAPVLEQLDWLRFALGRLARLPRGAVQRAALGAGAAASAAELDRTLIAPLAGELGERELVIVPTGSLHALPWAMFPSLRGRPLTVTPSAGTWFGVASARAAAGGRGRGRDRGRPRGRRAVLAAGPGLRHAARELRTVRAWHPDAVVLQGSAATVGAVMDALEGATVAHLACHGRFRADSPLFSCLELADGPLNVYELQRLTRAPELVVLSACDLALSQSRPGDELLGFAAALLELGTRTVLASGVPVPDAAAARLMGALHERLVTGDPPASALARAQRTGGRGDAALGGFVCLGRG
jgi:hypothetical protein